MKSSAPVEAAFLREKFCCDTIQLIRKLEALQEQVLQTNEIKTPENSLIPLSILHELFHKTNEVLFAYKRKVELYFQNPFDSLPDELIIQIFSYIPSFKELGLLQMVCKRFHQTLTSDANLWKNLCHNWWSGKEFAEKGLKLDWAVTSCDKDWRWFAQCFANPPKKKGLSWGNGTEDVGEYLAEYIAIGEMEGGQLQGWGVQLFDDQLSMGEYKSGQQQGKGTRIYCYGAKYEGEWQNNERHGHGIYTWAGADIYEGEWKRDKRNGYGLTVFPNGFSFGCEWIDDQPVDEDGSVHPGVKNCILEGYCTSAVTGGTLDYCQFIFVCDTCTRGFCYICKNACHDGNDGDHRWRKIWCPGVCDCVEDDTCRKKGNLSSLCLLNGFPVDEGDENKEFIGPPLKKSKSLSYPS